MCKSQHSHKPPKKFNARTINRIDLCYLYIIYINIKLLIRNNSLFAVKLDFV